MATDPAASFKQVLIDSIYLRKLKLDSPRVPQVFIDQTNIDLLQKIRSFNREIDAQRAEVTLTITVRAVASTETIFQLEVQTSGVFTITGYESKDRLDIKGKVCPEILFPFTRNTITDAAAKGGFPDVVLKPIDFATVFAESLREGTQPNVRS